MPPDFLSQLACDIDAITHDITRNETVGLCCQINADENIHQSLFKF